ncbi:4986_t:CDS:2 [Funneliformis geosporum]|uniref:4986_t:CDS:1 n=1 Tax=Funneliformis geosporum TaxID=1117311 RepID=A0A9W4SJ45_9GLOM|nr:4986_t:CDS:2 [Funneliformis geosporum]
MKFGKNLLDNQVSEWSQQYVDYKKLKKRLNPLISQYREYSMLTAAAEKSFFETLKDEVDKVELFYLELLDDLRTDFQSLILQSYRLQQQNSSAVPTFHDLSQKLHQLIKSLELVKTNFIPLNKLAIKKICKKHAKYVGGVGSSVDVENIRVTVLKTIQEERAWWKKGKWIITELLEEAKNFQWELCKMTIKHYHDMIP